MVRYHFDRKMSSFIRASFDDTTGTVSMVPASAICSSAVKVSLLMSGPAHFPIGAQAGAQEEYRHDDQEHMVTQQVHLLLIEPVTVDSGSGQKGSNHEVQTRPVDTETAYGQSDQGHVPAVALGQPRHQFAQEVTNDGEGEQKSRLFADTFPIHFVMLMQ